MVYVAQRRRDGISAASHGTAEALKSNSDIQEFYLGGGEATDFHNVKHYSRRKRWLS